MDKKNTWRWIEDDEKKKLSFGLDDIPITAHLIFVEKDLEVEIDSANQNYSHMWAVWPCPHCNKNTETKMEGLTKKRHLFIKRVRCTKCGKPIDLKIEIT